jgi:hypothetical protein
MPRWIIFLAQLILVYGLGTVLFFVAQIHGYDLIHSLAFVFLWLIASHLQEIAAHLRAIAQKK